MCFHLGRLHLHFHRIDQWSDTGWNYDFNWKPFFIYLRSNHITLGWDKWLTQCFKGVK